MSPSYVIPGRLSYSTDDTANGPSRYLAPRPRRELRTVVRASYGRRHRKTMRSDLGSDPPPGESVNVFLGPSRARARARLPLSIAGRTISSAIGGKKQSRLVSVVFFFSFRSLSLLFSLSFALSTIIGCLAVSRLSTVSSRRDDNSLSPPPRTSVFICMFHSLSEMRGVFLSIR